MANPEADPPETYGIWGAIFDNIYLLQRRNREARTRLQSSLDYLQDSLSSMRDAAVIVDERGAIEWSNAAALQMLELRYPEDRGQPVANLIRIPSFQQYLQGEDFYAPLRTAGGSADQRFFEFEVSSFGAGDRLIFIRDVTDRVRLEQMRQDFVGNVSHELRTPLTVIKGYIDTFLGMGDALEPQYVRPLQQIDQQANRMENLLKDLLWLSRIESVSDDKTLEPVDIAAMITEMQDEISKGFPGRELLVNAETSDTVLGDFRELHSAISNLVINALKYSGQQDQVTVRWYREGEKLCLAVADQGLGIDASHIPRLTERFYRVDDSRSSRTGGTGLGLAIVKHVAAAHEAELQIESELGKGSVFKLVFHAPG
ncbi:phosphate regulon sensor protein PhoR [Halioglobus pacificus]|uniref:Phosphate regulon sensor protein PhoR n=2 Tax=Parahalioglobus pacificus TaxID=930806 RepID=A0A918XEX3_9GAMM|nr:phosphate regulon sensor protein PhoR [Halioglobus pacificus]